MNECIKSYRVFAIIFTFLRNLYRYVIKWMESIIVKLLNEYHYFLDQMNTFLKCIFKLIKISSEHFKTNLLKHIKAKNIEKWY